MKIKNSKFILGLILSLIISSSLLIFSQFQIAKLKKENAGYKSGLKNDFVEEIQEYELVRKEYDLLLKGITEKNNIPQESSNFKCFKNTDEFYSENNIQKKLAIEGRTVDLICKKENENKVIAALGKEEKEANYTNRLDYLTVLLYSIIGDELIKSETIYNLDRRAYNVSNWESEFGLIKWFNNGSLLYLIRQHVPHNHILVFYKPYNKDSSELLEWCKWSTFSYTPSIEATKPDFCKEIVKSNNSSYLQLLPN